MSEKAESPGSTSSFETIVGTLTSTEIPERLAVSLARILDQLLQTPPHEIIITPEWLCQRHWELASHLFPEWAGRFRTLDVKVGHWNRRHTTRFRFS